MMATKVCPERSRRVHKPPLHGQVGNVRRPDLINPVNFQPPQQVRIDLMPWRWLAGPRPPVDGLESHGAHQSLHPLATHCVPLPPPPPTPTPPPAGSRKKGGPGIADPEVASSSGPRETP